MAKTTYTMTDPVRKMKRALKTIGKKDWRGLDRVHLDENGSIVTTDAYRAYFERKAWNGPSIDLPEDVARRMAKCKVRGNDTAEIDPYEDTVSVTMGDGTVIVGELEDAHRKFPNCEQFLDYEHVKTSIRVLRDDLLRVSRGYKKLKAATMMLVVEDGKFRTVSCVQDEWSGTERFTDADVSGEDVVIGFNPKFVVDFLNQTGGDEFVIEIVDPLKPAMFRDVELWEDGCIESAIMPKSLLEYEIAAVRSTGKANEEKGEKMARVFEKKAKEKAGAEVEATVRECGDGVTAIEVTTARIDITPEGVKATPIESHVETVEHSPEKPKSEESTAAEITVETIREMFGGDGIEVAQAREGSCIWVCGKGAKERKPELKELGFKYGKSKKYGKGWWVKPTA